MPYTYTSLGPKVYVGLFLDDGPGEEAHAFWEGVSDGTYILLPFLLSLICISLVSRAKTTEGL